MQGAKGPFSASTKFSYLCIKIENRIKHSKKKLESCQETSKLSADSFMASYDRMVPQKSNFWGENRRKSLKHVLYLPLVSELRDI